MTTRNINETAGSKPAKPARRAPRLPCGRARREEVLDPHRRGLGSRGRQGPDGPARPGAGERRPHRPAGTRRGRRAGQRGEGRVSALLPFREVRKAAGTADAVPALSPRGGGRLRFDAVSCAACRACGPAPSPRLQTVLSRDLPDLSERLLAALALARREQLPRPLDHRAQLFIGQRVQSGEPRFARGKSIAHSPFAALMTRHFRFSRSASARRNRSFSPGPLPRVR